jgi:hypothetical protein
MHGLAGGLVEHVGEDAGELPFGLAVEPEV